MINDDWDTIRLSQAYSDDTIQKDIPGATRVFKNLQDGEFTIPFGFLDYRLTEQLVTEGMLTDKEFVKIQGLYPDNSLRVVRIDVNIYRLMDN